VIILKKHILLAKFTGLMVASMELFVCLLKHSGARRRVRGIEFLCCMVYFNKLFLFRMRVLEINLIKVRKFSF